MTILLTLQVVIDNPADLMCRGIVVFISRFADKWASAEDSGSRKTLWINTHPECARIWYA